MLGPARPMTKRVLGDAIFLLLCMLVIVPVLGLIVALWYHRQHRESVSVVYAIVISTFIVGLVVFHWCCYARREDASPHLPKLMDYLYVSTAVVGLIVGAIVLENQESTRIYAEFAENIRNDIKSWPIGLTGPEADQCRANDQGRACIEIRSLISKATQKGNEVGNSNDLSTLLSALDDIVKYGLTLPNLPWSVREWLKNGEEAVRALNYLPSQQKSPIKEPDDTMKQVGAVLLASALALRLTKISVEIGKWWGEGPKEVAHAPLAAESAPDPRA
ncbi:hypothetical protein AWB80_01651 [Caballeronia pedi]|uniref:Transmembrane protein n=1 Tax=Caballeronia pedi TaxID=1777141 RepID=A0A158A103_9BURK|nr:hypothetical protein [Caballeronia pedi]SAK51492.1 hypothetical protein AWB80_01651 [Caballeronia pedi]